MNRCASCAHILHPLTCAPMLHPLAWCMRSPVLPPLHALPCAHLLHALAHPPSPPTLPAPPCAAGPSPACASCALRSRCASCARPQARAGCGAGSSAPRGCSSPGWTRCVRCLQQRPGPLACAPPCLWRQHTMQSSQPACLWRQGTTPCNQASLPSNGVDGACMPAGPAGPQSTTTHSPHVLAPPHAPATRPHRPTPRACSCPRRPSPAWRCCCGCLLRMRRWRAPSSWRASSRGAGGSGDGAAGGCVGGRPWSPWSVSCAPPWAPSCASTRATGSGRAGGGGGAGEEQMEGGG